MLTSQPQLNVHFLLFLPLICKDTHLACFKAGTSPPCITRSRCTQQAHPCAPRSHERTAGPAPLFCPLTAAPHPAAPAPGAPRRFRNAAPAPQRQRYSRRQPTPGTGQEGKRGPRQAVSPSQPGPRPGRGVPPSCGEAGGAGGRRATNAATPGLGAAPPPARPPALRSRGPAGGGGGGGRRGFGVSLRPGGGSGRGRSLRRLRWENKHTKGPLRAPARPRGKRRAGKARAGRQSPSPGRTPRLSLAPRFPLGPAERE